jgi:2-polyprenyl-6-methoxyphenol hydroxylase-like FAD-dependent oxidoreductase
VRLRSEVLVVGAGPTGLTVACQLRRLGVSVRIIDKKAGFSTTSKAIGLQYRVSEILACMGVADRFLAEGSTPTAVNIFVRNRPLVQLKFVASGKESGRGAFQPKAIVIPQSETERLLDGLLTELGGRVEWNCEFLGFEQDARGVWSRLKIGDVERECASDWLISCEGAHSVIREQAGFRFVGKTYPLSFLLADVRLEGAIKHSENYVWLHKNGSFAALPLPTPEMWRLFVDVTNARNLGEVSLDLIRQLMVERTGAAELKIHNPTWISEFKIHCRLVDRYRLGRVFVAGDAAHVHSPTGGQGIVTGIQDAMNLAWKMGRVLRGAPENLLDTYEQERRPRAAEVLKETDRTTRLLLAPDPFTKLIRNLIVLPVMRREFVQKKLFAKLAQLHVNYRGETLSWHSDSPSTRTVLKAGDRAPDIAFCQRGKMITLFGLLRPFRPIALARFDGKTSSAQIHRLRRRLRAAEIDMYLVADRDSDSPSDPDHLIDIYGDFARLYGIRAEFFCMIRPDDHIGVFQSPIDEDAITDYVARISPT